MYVRLITVRGATNIDEAVAFIRDSVVPDLRQQHGFESISVSGNRSTGTLTVLSLWRTEADRDASEGFSEKARNEALKVLGGVMTVDHFEQVVWEVAAAPPPPGAKLQVRSIRMDPADVDRNLAHFQETILPEIRSTPGFVAARQMIDRRTGEGRVGTVWTDDAALEVARRRADERRAAASSRGVEFGEELLLDVLYRA